VLARRRTNASSQMSRRPSRPRSICGRFHVAQTTASRTYSAGPAWGGASPDLDITLRAGGPVAVPDGSVRDVGLGGNLRGPNPHDKLSGGPLHCRTGSGGQFNALIGTWEARMTEVRAARAKDVAGIAAIDPGSPGSPTRSGLSSKGRPACLDHAKPAAQLGDRGHAGVRCQRGIRLATRAY
jgi:hypothetical protein